MHLVLHGRPVLILTKGLMEKGQCTCGNITLLSERKEAQLAHSICINMYGEKGIIFHMAFR